MRNNRVRTSVIILGTLVAFGVASELSAHDTWLFPSKIAVPVGTRLTLDLSSGMSFPKNEFAIDPSRIETAKARLSGRTWSMTRRVVSRKFLRLETTLSKPGVATLWISLKPRTLDLTPALIQEYLDEIGAPDSIRAIYPKGGKNPRWREEYRKEAKAFVFVGSAGADTSWKIPAGASFEIVPVSDPGNIASGQPALFRVLRNGLPLANFPIGSVGAGKSKPRLDRTDADGIVSIVAPAAGRWMLRATDLRRPPKGVDADWQSVFVTLSLNVRARANP